MKTITTILIAALVTGCATSGANYTPMIDTKNANMANYHQDLSECQAYAARQMGAGDGAVAGAVIGALLALAVAAVTGNSRLGGELAAFGAVQGGVEGAVSTNGSQQAVVSRCLQGRGYSVLS